MNKQISNKTLNRMMCLLFGFLLVAANLVSRYQHNYYYIFLSIAAAIFAHKHKPYKNFKAIACIGYAIPLVHILIFLIIGMIGFGPGLG